MKVRFIQWLSNEPEEEFVWFVKGKIYDVEKVSQNGNEKVLWVYGEESPEFETSLEPLFDGEYEIVSEAE